MADTIHPSGWYRGKVVSFFNRFRRLASSGQADSQFISYADPNHPLLQTLKSKVSGTYRHSILTAQLASYAGKKLEADELLLQVSARFHDISKMTSPKLFSEAGTANRGEPMKIASEAELRVFMGHPGESALMLRKNGFPEEICRIVSEHHGTTRTRLHLTPEMKRLVSPSQLIYPGPKPSSRESVLVMLADSVEAALNSRRHRDSNWPLQPSEPYLRGIIHEIARELRAAEQFDAEIFGQADQVIAVERMAKFMFYHFRGLDADSSSQPPKASR
jgi:putative nucleotidyltransferase with HDIG domain